MGGDTYKYSIFQPTIYIGLRVIYSNILSVSSKFLGFIYHLQVGSNEIVGVIRQIPNIQETIANFMYLMYF